MRSEIRVLIAARALLLAIGFVGGCTVEQVEPPTTDPSGEPQTGSGTTTTDGSTTDEPTTGTTGDPGGSSGGDACEGPNGCFNCPAQTPEQLLNACTDATCEPFPNTKQRLPLLNDDGTLPPLP